MELRKFIFHIFVKTCTWFVKTALNGSKGSLVAFRRRRPFFAYHEKTRHRLCPQGGKTLLALFSLYETTPQLIDLN